jgi:hypothetical protein
MWPDFRPLIDAIRQAKSDLGIVGPLRLQSDADRVKARAKEILEGEEPHIVTPGNPTH